MRPGNLYILFVICIKVRVDGDNDAIIHVGECSLPVYEV